MRNELVLAKQIPEGWLDDKQENRCQLAIGDLCTLLQNTL